MCVCFLFTVLDPKIEQYNVRPQSEEDKEQVCVCFLITVLDPDIEQDNVRPQSK